MLTLPLTPPAGRPLSLLFLGAHSDDIEIGCGGTVLRCLRENPGATVHWVVFGADGEREDEARASAKEFCADAGELNVVTHRFRDSFFPSQEAEIKERLEELKLEVAPDVVFTMRRDDAHQDHRTVAALTWTAFRDHLVLEYEIPKYEGDLGQPNMFVPLSDADARRKVDLLHEHFASQRKRSWFRRETFEAVMRLRAVECNAPDGWAEGFYARKAVLRLSAL